MSESVASASGLELQTDSGSDLPQCSQPKDVANVQRKARRAELQRKRRAALSPEQQLTNRQNYSPARKYLRQHESEEQRIQRLKKDADRHKRARANESEEQVQQRQKSNAVRQITFRREESAEQLLERRMKNAERQRLARTTEHKTFIARHSLTTFEESKVKCHDIGEMKHICTMCNALMFKDETHVGAISMAKFSLCCSKGAIKLPPLTDPPDTLKKLLTGVSARDRKFRDGIRAFNSSLAFASLCLTGQEYKFKSRGPYCFRINGQIYHRISHLQPEPGKAPSFSQIYIYDQDHQIDHRLRPFSDLDRDLLQELQDMIKEVNPYAQKYIQVANVINEHPTEDVKLVLKATGKTVDPRRYNLPTGSDVAIILPSENCDIASRDVVVYKNAELHPNGHLLMNIDTLHPMYDPLMYVLMFPHGDKGFELGSFPTASGKDCTALQYYRYRLMPRSGNTFNCIHRMGRLFQQYVVDVYAKIEQNRLRYLRYNQKQLRVELYQGLADALQNSDNQADGSHIGKRVILPSSFTGGARYQHQLYQDAMGIVRRLGKPDFFITFTCNPKWKEITDALLPNQTAENRQDIVARVFKLKLQALLHDLYYSTKPVLGRMTGLIYVIEWQKRGPPHAHILGICDANSKPQTLEDYDSIVCAEIPDERQFPELYQIVTKFMMHGPCGSSNPQSPCMDDGKCTKKFPKDFANHTTAGDGFPQYRRRNNGTHVIKGGVPLDNRWVVPYNAYLSKKYNAHINVEICGTVKSCKYLYKYVYKGPDMASVAVQSTSQKSSQEQQNVDEINRYVAARFISSSESLWRIFSFDCHGREPSIQRLAVHEENAQSVTFDETNPEEAISKARDTTLLAWFKLNQGNPDARTLKYHEIPEHYVWNRSQCKWMKRKQGRCIGRMYTTTPSQGERHYLRTLLHHVAGAKSFADLKTSPEGVIHRSFKDTAIALGLLESDEEWDQCLTEAAISFMPKQLRSLFVTILIFGEPAKPKVLWMKYKDVMGEDIHHQVSSLLMSADDILAHVDNETLLLIQDELESMGSCLEKFDLPTPDTRHRLKLIPRVVAEEMFDVDLQGHISKTKLDQLNMDQQIAYDLIMKSLQDTDCQNRLFFLNAPGGYGKTFLIETLLASVRCMNKIALAVASSGIAAELLEGGRTAHSRFKIPIPINESSVCSISLQSDDAKLMKKTSLIIWDEIMMSHVHQIDCVDRSLRDICKVDRPFGGIVVVFAGDPRQILPVIRHGNRSQIVKSCIQSSTLWSYIKQIKLTRNMRVHQAENTFADYLLAVGNGTIPVYPDEGDDMIKIPEEFLVGTVAELIEKVFPNIEDGYPDKYFVSRRAILTPINDNVDKINENIMQMFPGKGQTYLSADSVAEEDLTYAYPTDFLNSITVSGMPPHSMTLKVGAPVILLRNLRAGPGHGLRNGTRLLIKKLGHKVLEVEVASGINKGNFVLLPRITISPSDTELPFTLKRRQFPVRPCFAMSTNKAQGQTLDFVGIYLPDHVFTHGQLYVAFSRVRNPSSLAVYVNNTNELTKNIVYKEVL